MICYIIAGAIAGLFSLPTALRFGSWQGEIPPLILILMSFVGGVGGHALFALLNK
jgi:hypothetical protein